MYIDTQIEASEPYSGTSCSSSSLNGASSSPSDINLSRVGDLDGPFADARGRLEHLTLTSAQQHNTSAGSDSERARRLKALPTCHDIKAYGRKAMGKWGKSFALTEQQHLLPDLEPLEELKKKANSDLIQNQFKNLVKYSAGIKACYEGFQALRISFDDLASAEHMTIDQQIQAIFKLRGEFSKNKTALGKNAKIILESYHNLWKFQDTSVKETQNTIKLGLYTERDQQEDIQFALDMLKDGERLLPKIKEPSGLATGTLEGIGKYGVLKAMKWYKNKWQGSQMMQATYQEEGSKTDALNQNLDESRTSILEARATLQGLEDSIYSDVFIVIDRVKEDNTEVSYVAMANKLDAAEGKLLTFMELLEEFLAQITQEYGLKFGAREAKRLCSRVPNIFTALEMLLSAKEVVVAKKQSTYEEHIYELCKAISEHFNVMEGMHWECRDVVNMERQAAFLNDDVPRFQNGVAVHLQVIKDIAKSHISETKSKEARDKRAKQDRFYGNSSLTRRDRPLVTGEEISWALRKVIDALMLIGVVSGGSATFDQDAAGNTNCTEVASSNDSIPWFKMAKGMMNEFHTVLCIETKKLEGLNNKKQEELKDNRPVNARLNSNEEPKGRFARLLRLMTRKPR